MNRIEVRRDPSGKQVRWDATLAEHWRQSGYWLDTTLAEVTRELAARDGERVMVIEGERSWAVKEIWTEAQQLARALLAHGLRPGDVISYQIPNWYEGCVINLAASAIGAAVNPLVPIYRDNELRFMLADVKARLFIVPARFRNVEYAQMALRVKQQLDHDLTIVVLRDSVPGCLRYEDLLDSGPENRTLPSVDPDSLYVVMHTSGTTGRPKCVLHTHNTFLVQGRVHAQELQQASGDDVQIVPSPISHIAGMIVANVVPVFAGAKIVLMERWDANEAIDLIHRHGGSGLSGATPFLQQLLEAARARNDHLPSLRVSGSGGAAVPPELIRELHAWFPNTVAYRIYGSTEVPTATSGISDRSDIDHGADTDGRIKHTDVRIVDPSTGAPVPLGGEGEILLRGPQMMVGYLRPEDSEDAFDAEGYFRSGDLGRVVEGEYLLITGRKKDLIIRSGENISPKEIEDVLHTHPAIATAAVVGMPSARTGEAICAFITLRDGCQIDLPEIDRHVMAAGLSRRKVPEHVEILAQLPLSPQGKVQKNVLRDMAMAIAARERR